MTSSYHLRGKCSDECKKDSLNVPKLRFRGYNEEWVERSFDEIFEIIGNNTFSRDCLNYEPMGTKNIHYGDILVKFNTYIDEDYLEIPIIDSKINLDKIPKKNYLLQGDIIIADTAEDYTVGKSCEIFNIHSPMLAGLHTIPSRPKFHFAKGFLGYYLNSNKYHDRLIPLITGIKVSSISKKEIKKTVIKFPSLPEQEKIASFLTLIDKKIEKQKELIELLKKYKRGLLSQIFSQKLRFKDKNGNNYPDWEEKRLGDICTTFSGGTPSVTHQEYYNGEIPFIKSGEIHSDKTEMFITDIGLKNSSAKLVKKGDLLFALYGATSGEVDISKINGAINQAILCVQSDTLNLNYLKELLSYNKNKILCKYLQGGQGNLSADIFKSLKFKFPTKKEQDKISDFLINYDKITNIEEDLLNLYINYKQGLLQQLFI